ncbi:MAG TPA: sigma-70 family RNA polymerase sigma factor [Anaerolineales bacterium]|nr:sigma-70 family RNA polymerase sigma factor [Anaerolineales bacterium]
MLLISSAQAGDLNSFNTLVLAYQNLVFNAAFRILGDRFAADDAAQDTFILAFRNLSSFRGGSFRSWLWRIVINVCRDQIRRNKRRPTVRLAPPGEAGDGIESPWWISDPGESPEQRMERADLAQTIQACLDELPLEYRLVVTLVDIQEMDYAEAAETMGLPIGTVKSRLARARARLSLCLQPSLL